MTINVGIVGLGNMGRNHLRVLSSTSLRDVAVWGAADPSAEAADWVSKNAEGLPLWPSVEEMLLDTERPLDAVIVSSPTTDHRHSALAALEAGCSVLVEKPLASTIAQAMDIFYHARKPGQVLMCGLIERFNPAVTALHNLLQIGNEHPILFDARRSGLHDSRPGSVASDLGTHDVDVINYLVGDWPYKVGGYERSGAFVGGMEYPGGQIGNVTADWLSPSKVRELRVVCKKRTYYVDYLKQTLTVNELSAVADSWQVEVKKAEPLRLELDYFTRLVATGAPDSLGTALAGVHAVQAIERMIHVKQ